MPEIEIQAKDGGIFSAYIALPQITPAPAIIMIQEIFGVNQEMRDKCDELAKLGYIGICPDLFWRIEPGIDLVDSKPEQLERAFELFGLFDQDAGMKDLTATLETIRKHPDCNGKVGCVGYCLGGRMAYRMAAETDIDASVSYYGVGLDELLDKSDNITKPYIMHIAGEDDFVPKDAQDKIMSHMANKSNVETYHYPGMDHAFARGNGMHYNEEAATLANTRTYNFLAEHLK